MVGGIEEAVEKPRRLLVNNYCAGENKWLMN